MHSPSSASNRLSRITAGLDVTTRTLCRWGSYLTLVMVLLMLLNVVLRYGFELGWIALQESVTYLHACAFLLGLGYTLQIDEHVRVDVFYRRFSARRQALVNLLGSLFLLLPVCAFLLYYSVPYAVESWKLLETSKEPGGLPLVFILKSVIPLGIVLLGLQGISEAIKNFQRWQESKAGQ
ncbi:TRAP transporter small permease subunit [Alteromonas gilva]|uniref:TRAP transporter small permease protein n=1 Tax=Alteromonas gilva TaxID=2987522 RepID=A0ABT5L5C6_9ALTE|nr:TRAP transporter small permease subunit [Alteromonas gilva]MDC8832250.1 TRAP transporter small permease subunit [Alteromonas gilva]